MAGTYIRNHFLPVIFLLLASALFIACDSDEKDTSTALEEERLVKETQVQTRWSGASQQTEQEEKGEAITTDENKETAVATRPVKQEQPKKKAPKKQVEKKTKTAKVEKKRITTSKKVPHIYSLQVGAFRNRSYANRLVLKLKNRGYKAYITKNTVKGKSLNIVRIGKYKTKQEAFVQAERFFKSEDMKVVVSSSNATQKIIASFPEKRKKQAITSQKRSEKATIQKSSDPIKKRVAPEKTKKEVVAATTAPVKKPAKSEITKPAKETKKEETKQKFKKQFGHYSASSQYSFQIGGLHTQETAAGQLKALQKKGYSPYLDKIKDRENGELWYVVKIGYFATLFDAADAAYRFSEVENIPAQAIIPEEE